MLPLNYQYPVSAWIYKVLSTANKEFADMLHDNGYRLLNGKTFKLFTFSRLQFPKHTWKIIPGSDRMQIWSRNAWLTISFQLPEQSENFVMGLFKEQHAFIGDKVSGIDMNVENLEILDVNKITQENISLKAITPIVLGLDIEGEENEQYVTPVHPGYRDVFLNNLIDKYKATGKTNYATGDLDLKIKKLYAKTAMQVIKANTDAETKVKAYYFDFEITAPKEIIEVGLNAGFGSMNSLGFGFCDVVG
jgi:CRISPR-associated endoribonuclease Cas6